MSSNNNTANSESKTTILLSELEIARLKLNIQLMQTKHEEPTFKLEQSETYGKMQTRQDVLGRLNKHDELVSELPGLANGWGDGYPYIHFRDLIVKCKLREQDALDTLQKLGCLNPDLTWHNDMEVYGLIFNFTYDGFDREFDIFSRYNHIVCSPHGHRFFEELFTGRRTS